MLRDLLSIRRDPLAYLQRTAARWGDHVAFPMPRTPVLLVGTVAGARRVLVENAGAWSKATVQYGALSLVTGSGLLTSDGSAWREARRVAQPAFHRSGLAAVAEQSVAAAERVRARAAAQGEVVDVDAAVLQATLEVVGRTLFGGDVTADGERVVAAVLEALEVVIGRARTPLPTWLPTPAKRRLARANAVMDQVVARVVSRRRAAGDLGDDLLGLLLRAVDEGRLPPEAVRAELVTMVIAGHETVASCLTWTLDLLARNPRAQERLHAELDAVLGSGPAGGPAGGRGHRAPTWEDLRALPWTRAVVDESLRLYPPAWVVTRRAETDDVVDGVAVPAGTLVIVSPWLLQRRADAHPDPERFDPGRFTGEGPEVPRGAYLPFGAGARLCIGRDFALTEAVLVLAALLRDRRVDPVPGDEPVLEALVTLRPRGGLRLRLRPR